MSDNIRDMVEDPGAHPNIRTAKNMADAANAGQPPQGYAAVSGLHEDEEIARLAYQYFQQRQQDGTPGSADGDWFRAEAEVRRGGLA